MGYVINPKEAKLQESVEYLESVADVRGRCLGYVREATSREGLRLPPPQVPHSTALACFHALAADPAKYGWQKVGSPDVHPITLSFFHNCGTEPSEEEHDGKIVTVEIVCGHVALWQKRTGILRSSFDYNWSEYWLERLVGEFVPLP